jgi:hypothetical protein
MLLTGHTSGTGQFTSPCIPDTEAFHFRMYTCIRQHTSAYVSIRQHTSAYVSIRQHTSAYVSIRQHASACVSTRQHTSEHVSIRQDTSAYVSIRAYAYTLAISMRTDGADSSARLVLYLSIRQHSSAYCQHTSAYVSILSAYVSACALTAPTAARGLCCT